MSIIPRVSTLFPTILFAVPKSRVTKHRRGFKLRDNKMKFHLKIGYTSCTNCGTTIRTHNYCKKCISSGYYPWNYLASDTPLKAHPLQGVDPVVFSSNEQADLPPEVETI